MVTSMAKVVMEGVDFWGERRMATSAGRLVGWSGRRCGGSSVTSAELVVQVAAGVSSEQR
jgi:hypothetical protein